MELAQEILELMRQNADHGGTPPEKAAAIAIMFVQRETSRLRSSRKRDELLAVASRIAAGRSASDYDVIDGSVILAKRLVEMVDADA